jgi:murein DD-endopeptidase MepM/ murein hydrolase activator NlpD
MTQTMIHWLRLTLIFAFIFSNSCAQKKAAQIVNHSKDRYDRNKQTNRETSSVFDKKITTEKSTKGGEIEVASGETLYSVSRKYQVSVRDLVEKNNLNPPYIMKPGDRLVIPSAIYHQVNAGDTLYSISRLYGMKVDRLVELNNLHEPYSVKVGERIKISPNSEESTSIAEKNETKKPEPQTTEKPGIIASALDKLNHFSWPIRGKVISKFGPKSGGLYNDGIKIKAKEGTEVKASEDGVVAYVGNELKGYGNLVIIKHGSGWITAYAHLKNWTVKRGEKIGKGQKIGYVGSTGNVDSPQLYFGLRKGRDAVNPENYLK